MKTEEQDALTAAVIALTRHGIPPDIQELLVYGNPERNVPPGALKAAIDAARAAMMTAGFAIVPRVASPAMLAAANALPITRTVDGVISAHMGRTGVMLVLPGSPDTPMEQWWAAMVGAAK